MDEKTKQPFVPAYWDMITLLARRFGAAQLGGFMVLAKLADFSREWTVSASLRELAEETGMSVNTLKKSLLEPLARAGIIAWDSADRKATRIKLTLMQALENGEAVSKFDTDTKNQTVSKSDTDKNGFFTLFPQYVVQKGGKTVSNFDTESEKNEKTVSKSDTVQSVSNFDTDAPSPHLSPVLLFNNNINNKYIPNEPKKNKFVPSLAEIKAFFAEKNFITDPEEFYHKNEARGWMWVDKAGKSHKIKNWKSTAYEFEKRTKARGAVNFNNPQKTEEKLFVWYYQNTLPELFDNEAARDTRWQQERGHFAFIATVAKDFERGKDIIQKAAETLENARLTVSVRAIANMAMTVNEKLGESK